MKAMRKYRNGGKNPISRKEYNALMERLRTNSRPVPLYADPRKPSPKETSEMTKRERFKEAERLSDPYGYFVGQIESSKLPRTVDGVAQVVTGMDYGGGEDRVRRGLDREGGRKDMTGQIAGLIENLQGEQDESRFGYSRSLRRKQLASQYVGEERDKVLEEFDNETARMIFEENRRRLGRNAAGGMKYRVIKRK